MLRVLVALSLTLFSITLPAAAAADAPSADDVLFSSRFEAPTIRLRGVVSFTAPLAFAKVILTSSNGQTHTSTADAEGKFELALEAYGENEVFDVRARGIGNQSWLEFAAWLGDGAFLRSVAGPEGIIDRTALPALHVNPYQTGIYLAIRDLPPSSSHVDRPAQRAAASYSSNDATKRGALVALLAEGGAGLPAGAATTLQAVGELPFAIQLVEGLGGEFYCYGNQPESPECIALARVVSDPAQVPITSPPTDLALHPYTSFELGFTQLYTPRILLSATGNGEAQWTEPVYSPSKPIIWTTLPSGLVRAVHRDGLPLHSTWSATSHPSCNCPVLRETAEMALRAQYVRGPLGTLNVTFSYEREYRYPDNPEIPTEFPEPSPFIRLTQVLVGDRPLHASPVVQEDAWILPHCGTPNCLGTGSPETSEAHLFNADGTGITRRSQLNFQWSINPLGNLLIAYADGTRARHMIASADRDTATLASVMSEPNGDVMAISQPFMRTESRGFEPADVIGFQLRPLRGCQRPFAQIEIACRSTDGFSFAEGGTGTGGSNASPLTWSIDAQGRLFLTRYASNGLMIQRRLWERVAEIGDTLYLLEQTENRPIPVFDPTIQATLTGYRKIPRN